MEEKQIQKRAPRQVALVRRAGRFVSSRPTGRYNTSVVLELLRKEPDRLHTLRDITIAVYGGYSPRNEDYVHKNLSYTCRKLQDAGHLCYIIFGEAFPHQSLGLKLHTGSEDDAKNFQIYLERAKARKEISALRYDKLFKQAQTFEAIANKQ
jgi:hypothetical protein